MSIPEDDSFLLKEGQPPLGATFPIPVDVTIKYGADTRWVKKDFKKGDKFRCDNNTFGKDPAYGSGKSCWVVGTKSSENMNSKNVNSGAASQTGTSSGDIFLFAEGGGPSAPAEENVTIKYGADTRWATKEFKKGETFKCDNATFGDPAYGTRKSCFRVVPLLEKSSSDITKNGRFTQSGGEDTGCIEPGCIFIRNYKASLDKCKYDCLSDPACTNINYNSADEACQQRRCNNPEDPIGTRNPGWTMFAFIPTDPMDPDGKMSKLTAAMRGVGEIATQANEYGNLAWSEASLLLDEGVSTFGYVLGVIALIVFGVAITLFAWKTLFGSSSASTINSAPPNIISR
jgi:hypothetical protein